MLITCGVSLNHEICSDVELDELTLYKSPRPTGFAGMKPRRALLVVVLFAIIATCLESTEAAEEGPPTVGISRRIADLILPGTELKTMPIEDDSPIVIRIENTRVHGTAFRYDIVYYGLEPGEFDLRDYFARLDGTSTDDLPNIPVRIQAALGDGQIVPNELTKQPPPRIGGYRTMLWTLGAIWILGLLALIFYPRSRNARAVTTSIVPKTLADQLRPYIESAGRGELSDHDKGELERLLLAHWHDKLDLGGLAPGQAITQIRNDENAGKLFRSLEQWLHSPNPLPLDETTISELLRPYQGDSDASGARLGSRL